MLDKDDYVSRKLRSYLKEKEEYQNTWHLYFYIKDTLIYEDWPKLQPTKTESGYITKALEDWKEYQKQHEEPE